MAKKRIADRRRERPHEVIAHGFYCPVVDFFRVETTSRWNLPGVRSRPDVCADCGAALMYPGPPALRRLLPLF